MWWLDFVSESQSSGAYGTALSDSGECQLQRALFRCQGVSWSWFLERSRELGRIHKSHIQNHHTEGAVFNWSSKKPWIFWKHPPRPSFCPGAIIQNVMLSICHRHQRLLTIASMPFCWRRQWWNNNSKVARTDISGLGEERLCSFFSCDGHLLFIEFDVTDDLPSQRFDFSNFFWKAALRIWKELHPRTPHRISP